jgi:hypothetical protein
MLNKALKSFSELISVEDKNKGKYIYSISYALAPAIELNTQERFLAMFRSLETCRKFANVNILLTDEDKQLIEALCKLKNGLSDSLSKRIQGFVNIIKNPNLPQQLKSVLNEWDVFYRDLWPLIGKKGIIGIRDKLSHTHLSSSVNSQGLAVATWHLSILLERIFFNLLSLKIENTGLSDLQLKRKEWMSDHIGNICIKIYLIAEKVIIYPIKAIKWNCSVIRFNLFHSYL